GFVEEARAPFPEALNRVDEAGHDHGEGQEGPQLHAFCHRTGYHRHAGRGEHDLEEEVGTGRVVRRVVATSEDRVDGVLVTDQETQAGDDAAFGAGVHDVVADHQVHHACQGIQRDVLGKNLGGVLGADQTGFEHGET